MHRLKLGIELISIRSKNQQPVRFGLAPMEGVTDIAVRLWFALTTPPDFVWTPFLRVTDTFPASQVPRSFIPEQTILRGAVPFAVIPQLMGSRPEDVARVAAPILEHVPFIDLNCGCPSPTVVGSRAGSSLLEHSELFHAFIGALVRELGSSRLSVKMRTGFHSDSEFSTLIDAVESFPLVHLTIHGRTRPQRYTGLSDWTLIDAASKRLSYPVVGSGDIVDAESAERMRLVAPAIKTSIIGRGALRNPWIFGDISQVPLIEPLIAFGLMQQLGLYHVDLLLAWAADGGASTPAGNSVEAWHNVIASLQKCLNFEARSLEEIEIDSRAFARVKMLWNYFRSSLPPPFMEPTILRSKSLTAFCKHLLRICQDSELDAKSISLRYRQDLDWLYAGQGRGKASPSDPTE